jgi:hypothetical protein
LPAIATERAHGRGPVPELDEIERLEEQLTAAHNAIEDAVWRVRRNEGERAPTAPAAFALISLAEYLDLLGPEFRRLGEELSEAMGLRTTRS